jgi:hypothetical protein
MSKIQIVYHPGTYGRLLRWLLDRFSPDCKFKHINDPWDKDNRVHGKFDYNRQKFICRDINDFAKPLDHRDINDFPKPLDPSADKIVINFRLDDFIFAERCAFYRIIGHENEKDRYQILISNSDSKLLNLFKIDKNKNSKTVTKELYKIQLHDAKNGIWWDHIIKFMSDSTHYQFPVYALWNKDMFIQQLKNISDRFALDLEINETIIYNVTKKIGETYTIKTKDRAKDVLEAVQNKKQMDCSELDILEQAWIEVILEKQHDSVIFPYGANWFKDTNQINEFLNTYPSYLKHMNPRLPWYNNIKNPFYWGALTEEQKPYTIKEIVEATKNIAPELWKK